MKIFISSDHAGFELKQKLVPFLRGLGHEVVDLGPEKFEADDDYPDYSVAVAREIATLSRNGAEQTQKDAEEEAKGIIIGGSGQGEAMAANRFRGVRAVVFNGQYRPPDGREVPDEIALSRQHNDANVLALGARFLNFAEASAAVEKWLRTPFSGDERHVRRLRKIDELGK